MPKKSKHPKLRVHVKRGRAGQIWTSYWYDMRGTGKPDVSLGTDRAEALRRWDELYNERPRLAGTLEEAFRAWETEALPHKKSPETRSDYTKSLRQLRPFFGPAQWADVSLPTLVQYLRKRTAKERGRHEMRCLSVIWNWARINGYTVLPYPAHGMERSGWMGQSGTQAVEVSDEAFAAIHKHADQTLKDALDIATATGLRVTDVLGLRLSDVRGDWLQVQASKGGKVAKFDLRESVVLPAIITRRKAVKTAEHLFLLAAGRKPITYRMLRDRFVAARAAAAKECPECKTLQLRYMRKRAAQLSDDADDASKLLQHSSKSTTRRHYLVGEKLKPVR
jgi:integrase